MMLDVDSIVNKNYFNRLDRHDLRIVCGRLLDAYKEEKSNRIKAEVALVNAQEKQKQDNS